jgi:ADP-heptose:LPS heptosyltransferase
MKPTELRRIAVLRNDRLGDLVFTLPLFEALRQGCPHAQITAIVHPETAPLLNSHPHVDQVLTADKSMPMPEFVQMLRSGSFDAVLLTYCNSRNAMAAFRARIPIRVTHARRWYRLLLGTHRFYQSRRHPPLHEAEFALAFAHRLGISFPLKAAKPYLFVDSASRRAVEQRIAAQIGGDGPLFAVHPGSRNSAFNWSLDNYLETIRRLASFGRVIVTGSSYDEQRLDWLMARLAPTLRRRVMPLTNLTLTELVAALSLVDSYVSAATGPLHVASIVSRSALGLYSDVPYQHHKIWRPIGAHASIISAPWKSTKPFSIDSPLAEQHMAQISVDMVVERMLQSVTESCAA